LKNNKGAKMWSKSTWPNFCRPAKGTNRLKRFFIWRP